MSDGREDEKNKMEIEKKTWKRGIKRKMDGWKKRWMNR